MKNLPEFSLRKNRQVLGQGHICCLFQDMVSAEITFAIFLNYSDLFSGKNNYVSISKAKAKQIQANWCLNITSYRQYKVRNTNAVPANMQPELF